MAGSLVNELRERRTLDDDGLRELLESRDESVAEALRNNARAVAAESFGRVVFLRALIEWSNVCRNDCYYCGIRRSNPSLERYSLTKDEILSCCKAARIHPQPSVSPRRWRKYAPPGRKQPSPFRSENCP